MLEEMEILVRQREVQAQKQQEKLKSKHGAKSRSGESSVPVMMGGQIVDEEEFENEKLCQICCFQEIDTEFVPCQHQTCKKCIQTHMLNNEKCPFCNAEIKSLQFCKQMKKL